MPDKADDDPWENLVLDENFIRGGVHEPPARTREAISRYGDDKTSWRQGGPTSSESPRRRRSGRGRMLFTVTAVVAVVVTGLFAYRQFGGGPSGADVAGTVENTVGGGGAGPENNNEVLGITPQDALGSCYVSDSPDYTEDVALSAVACSEPHDFELVSYQMAQGEDDVYPADAYWDDSVYPACYRDMVAFSGKQRQQWPASWQVQYFVPTDRGWAVGDRTIYCLAATSPPATGSVRDPVPTGAVPDPGDPIESVEQSRTIRTA